MKKWILFIAAITFLYSCGGDDDDNSDNSRQTIIQPTEDTWINISPVIEMGAAETSKRLVVNTSSNVSWTISKDVDGSWLTVSPTSGSGQTIITLAATTNKTGHERSTTLRLTGGGQTQSIVVLQSAVDPTTTPDESGEDTPYWLDIALSIDLPPEGGSKKMVVNTPTGSHWTISKDADGAWLSVTPMNGNGQAIVTLSAEENDTGGERSTLLTVTGDGKSVAYYVAQSSVKDTSTPDAFFSSCPDDHHPHTIDLGLPSGTLWSCCNVDATCPEEYGGYYAWGETAEKGLYVLETYFLTPNSDAPDDYYYGYTDIGTDISGTQYDVAHVKWGGSWQMPTIDQIEELGDRCTTGVTTFHGVKGHIFIGRNDNRLFIPAAGFRWDEDHPNYRLGVDATCWSSSLNTKNVACAYLLRYMSNMRSLRSYAERYYGAPVRAVVNTD